MFRYRFFIKIQQTSTGEEQCIEACSLELQTTIFASQKMQTGSSLLNKIKLIIVLQHLIVDFNQEILLWRARYFWIYLRVSSKEYDLYIRIDTNTNGHMQWFYFSIKNYKKSKIKINIFRFKKRYSLFQRGFRPYVKSRRGGKDWLPGGQNVKYLRQCIYNQNGVKTVSNFYYLTFTYTFQHQNDEVFMAACIPYTSTYLSSRLAIFQQKALNRDKIKFQINKLCTSICGQQIEVISIDPNLEQTSTLKKNFIIINTRSHPGETVGSWVLDGLLQTIVEDPLIQEWMVNMNICFRIVPMLNKDGVFMGNYRTGIVGDDFNRKFATGQREFFPQINAVKLLVSKCKKFGKVKLFFDLHGHSILKNSFIFGPDRRNFQDQQLINLGDELFECSKYFSKTSSYYKDQRAKIQTARVFFQFQEEIPSLTCQNSLGLYTDQYQTFQNSKQDWRTFGNHIVYAMKQTLSKSPRDEYSGLVKKYSQNLEDKSINKGKVYKNTIKAKNQTKLMKFEDKGVSRNSISQQKQVTQLLSLKKTTPVSQRASNSTRQASRCGKINNTIVATPWRLVRERSVNNQRQRAENDTRIEQQALQKSIIMTRYVEQKQYKQEQSPSKRISKTASIQMNLSKSINLQDIGQSQLLPENFSETYVSINDTDSESDDIQFSKKEELFKYIKALSSGLMTEQLIEQSLLKDQLLPLKGFKQYKLNFQPEILPICEKKPVTKLKPLKFQQFKMRGYTQKKIKGNLDVLFANQSLISTDRQKARMLINNNETLCRKNKQMKREELLAEMFPHKEESQYLLMRIKEMTLQSVRDTDK